MKTKMIAGAVAAGVLVLGGLLLKAGNEEETRKAYDAFKESFGLDDTMSEGAVSFGFFSGVLTVEQPEIRQRARGSHAELKMGLQAYAQIFSGMGQTSTDYAALIGRSVNAGDAIVLTADKLEIKAEGDEEDGSFELAVYGVDMSKPFVTDLSGELVAASEIADELEPSEEVLNSKMRTTLKEYEWRRNAVNQVSGVGNWIINGTGAFSATADAKLSVSRDSSGEGEMSLVVKHYLDGSQIGEIKRVIAFEKMPDMETMLKGLKASGQSLIFAAAGGQGYGGVLFGPVFESLSRKAMVSDYSVEYSGYDIVKEVYEDAGSPDMQAFCQAREMMRKGLLSEVKKDIDDSECAIAKSLIENGSYVEKLTFNPDKPVYPQLAVGKKYEITIN